MPHSDLPPPPDRDAIDELLAGHALGDLDVAEQARLRQHLAADPSLRSRLEELNTTLQLLPLALPEQPLPPGRLRQRLLHGQRPASGESGASRPAWGRLVMAALAGGLLVTGLQVHQLRQQLAVRPEPTQGAAVPAPAPTLQVDRTLPMRGEGAGSTASGQVVVQTGRPYNLLRIQGLPSPPPDHVYRLWADVDGRQVGCVQFLPDDMGVVSMPIPTEPSSHARRLSIRLEPLRPGGDRPQGPRVLTSV
ncbi:anti-sigma factor domain-containing protein [Cyanobium sp. NIES-981]|uniref:anti-sigma factor domain-containing protein n=1 Tax=Cyanobium sp. NIES-981 TaxID=1851505 RepID=UPI0007DDC33E|nr:anti-sigma factor [Cyanobium sp. NIES-981]SBO42846.1 conserved protein of unknown function [Cyanobium sp. NIES-981]